LQKGATVRPRDGENTAIWEQDEGGIGHGGLELGPDRWLGKQWGEEI
jgi:hypothetical protein